MYIQAGGVKLSVLSKTGREAVVAMLVPRRLLWREVITRTTILIVAKAKMVGLLHQQHAMSDRFIARHCQDVCSLL
jgi:hypothetical protein